jgi:hypothetical protein
MINPSTVIQATRIRKPLVMARADGGMTEHGLRSTPLKKFQDKGFLTLLRYKDGQDKNI